jgi:hypothetical protein
MKRIAISILMVIAAAMCSTTYGQRETPAGAGDKNLGEDNVKLRSVELERIKREAAQAEAASFAPISKDIVKKFPVIKEDFEGIQLSQAEIIKAYTTGKTIDYSAIENSAEDISKKSKRLDTNLFDVKKDAPDESKLAGKDEKVKSVRDLIVDLDTAIGSFVSSKIFGNIKIIEPEVAIQTRKDLDKIQYLSKKLSEEAKKMK